MKKINVLMVGVDQTSIGGMRTVANMYLNDMEFNNNCNLIYVGTAIRKNIIIKLIYFAIKIPYIFYILSHKKIDILHVHMAEKTSVFRKGIVMRMAKRHECKIIVHMHAGPFVDWYSSISERKKRKVQNILNLSDLILVLGEFWKQQMEKIVPKKKLEVLYNGITCPDLNNYNIEARDISFVGHLRKEKGIYDLLRAIEIIRDRLPSETKVHLCGSCDEISIENEIEKRGLSDIIEYHGWIGMTEMEKILQLTSVNILPTYVEGLSMTVLESMANGIPIITTNVTTMPELLDGIIEMVTPGDVEGLAELIVSILNNKEQRRKISKLEYERVCEKFSSDRMIKNTLQFYSKILED